MLGIREGGRNHDFPAKLDCLKVPKHIVKESFCVSESFGCRKTLGLRGNITTFHETFLSHRAENFRREPISVSLFSSIEKVSTLRGLCQDFL